VNARYQRMCIWCGPVLAVLFLFGFGVLARFIPPPDPALAAEAIAAKYRGDAFRIRLGMELSMWAGALSLPWAVAISVQMKRIEGAFSPLTYVQLGMGILLVPEFIIPFYFFLTAAYRPERSVEVIQTLNDLGWLPFDGLIYTVCLEALVIGIAILGDKQERPVFPRWVGYLNVWCALLMAPAGLDFFFKSGPLAWNGMIAWWVLFVAFFVWLAVMTTTTLRAISNHESEFSSWKADELTVGRL